MSKGKKMHSLIGEGIKKVINLSQVVEVVKRAFAVVVVAPRFLLGSQHLHLTLFKNMKDN